MTRKKPRLQDAIAQADAQQELLTAVRRASAAERGKARFERLYRAAEKENARLIEQLSVHERLGSRPPVRIKTKHPKRTKGNNATGGFLFSDWHCEERVDPKTINGLNDYTLDICERSAEESVLNGLRLLEDARQMTDIRKVVVGLLGDFISGHIHPELVQNNQLSPIDAIGFAGDLLERGLRQIAADSGADEITVITCVGNHGRTTTKWQISTAAANSYEQSMYKNLRRATNDIANMNWIINEGAYGLVDIEGHATRWHHGNYVRYQGGVHGPGVGIYKAIGAWNKTRFARYDFLGHLHQFQQGSNYVCNGSMIGYNAYAADELKAQYEPPQQAFFVIDAKRGMTRAVPIFCREFSLPGTTQTT